MLRAHLAVWGLAVGLAGCEPPATQPAPVPPAAKSPRAPAQRTEPKTGPPQFEVSAVALSPDAKLALTGFHQVGHGKPRNMPLGKWVMLWDMVAAKRLRTFVGHEGGIKLVAFLPGGKHALSAGGQSIRVWELKTGKQIWAAKVSGGGTIAKVALSDNGNRLLYWGAAVPTADADLGTLHLWDTQNGKLIRGIAGFEKIAIRNISLTPDGRLAFISSDCYPGQDIYLRVLDVTTGKVVQSFKRQNAWHYPYAYRPDSKLALSDQRELKIGAKGHLVLWNLATGKVVRHFPPRRQERESGSTSPERAVFTPDGKRVLVADDDGRLRTWDVAAARELSAVRLPGWSAMVAFSTDTRRLLVAYGVQNESKSIRLSLWDTGRGTQLNDFEVNAERWRPRQFWTKEEAASYPE